MMQDKAPAPAGSTSAGVLLSEMHGRVQVLTLNRPAQRNSLSEALIAALQGAIDTASA
jgi:enoyl-CoA hydratase/carnithine racemase